MPGDEKLLLIAIGAANAAFTGHDFCNPTQSIASTDRSASKAKFITLLQAPSALHCTLD